MRESGRKRVPSNVYPLNAVRPVNEVLPRWGLWVDLVPGQGLLRVPLSGSPMAIVALPLLTHRPNFYLDAVR